MTSPLREMTEAVRADGARRLQPCACATGSRDEVGQLAAAFNTMAQDLATVDRERRDLVATVSHELRTPLTALGLRLENLVDGVEEPDPDVLEELLAQTRRLGGLVGRPARPRRGSRPASRPLRLAEVELAWVLGPGGRRADRSPPARSPSTSRCRRRAAQSCWPTRPACVSWSPTCSTTRPGTAPPAAWSRSAPPRRPERSRDLDPRGQRPRPGRPARPAGAGLRALRDPRPATRAAAPASAWPSPGRSPSCTAAPCASWTRRSGAARAPGSGSSCPSAAHRRPPEEATACPDGPPVPATCPRPSRHRCRSRSRPAAAAGRRCSAGFWPEREVPGRRDLLLAAVGTGVLAGMRPPVPPARAGDAPGPARRRRHGLVRRPPPPRRRTPW